MTAVGPSPMKVSPGSSCETRPSSETTVNGHVARQLAAVREAQRRWSQLPLTDRLRRIRSFRHQLVEHADALIQSVKYAHRRGPTETLAAELIPLADACRFLELDAPRILAARRLSRRSRPRWMSGVNVELVREPLGVVLIVAAANYPLFLAGVQMLQALAAGNGVLLKPGTGASAAAHTLHETLALAGLDASLVQVLPEDTSAVKSALQAGVDRLVLTGSADTGRLVLAQSSETLTPATMELSGCDAVFVLPDADLDRLVKCLVFGLRFNGGATCMGPRRIFVPWSLKERLERRLTEVCAQWPPGVECSMPEKTAQLLSAAVAQGARILTGAPGEHRLGSPRRREPTFLTDARPQMQLLRTDILAPVLALVPVASIDEALLANRHCPFALGAAVFGDARTARKLAGRIDAGCIVINDLIAPTADPRVPLAGRRHSGFGVTRGAAGLEEMTLLKAIVHRRGHWLAHLDESTPCDTQLLRDYLGLVHGRDWRTRMGYAWSAVRTAIQQRRWKKSQLPSGKGE